MHKLYYYFIRIITFPFSFFPYSFIHFFGKILGNICYYILSEYRKITLSNLSLAKEINLNKKELKKIAKKSFQNLAITILEYPKLYYEKNLKKLVHCKNPQIAQSIYNSKKGIIFFCGHQANWELLFLDGNIRMKGIAIGKPIKNKMLYDWIVSIREKTNGKIISPKNALKESLKGLKDGKFIGIVGDQAMPENGYHFPFLGRSAWTSPSFALLSYKTNSPIIVATIKRQKRKYIINYSDPIFPDKNNSKEKEIPILINKSLKLLSESIKKNPDQWLWQHNRWKQQTPRLIYKKFRLDSILVILPKDFNFIKKASNTLRKIYPNDYLSLFIKKEYENISFPCDEIIYYKDYKDVFIDEYKWKLVYNFTSFDVKDHFKKRSAIEVFDLEDLKKEVKKKYPHHDVKDISDIIIRATHRSYA